MNITSTQIPFVSTMLSSLVVESFVREYLWIYVPYTQEAGVTGTRQIYLSGIADNFSRFRINNKLDTQI